MNDPDFRPAAFLVDLDGVLVHSHPVHIEAYERAFAKHGLTLSPETRRLVEDGTGRSRVLAHADVPEELSGVLSEAKEEAFLALVEAGALEAAEGVEAFLKTLKESGCPAAVVSNSATARECVAAMGWSASFRGVIGADDVTRAKPDPEPYRTAAALLGVAPDRCIAVEDSATGAASARAAGTFVVGVGKGVAPDQVDVWGTSLAALPLDRWLDPAAVLGKAPR